MKHQNPSALSRSVQLLALSLIFLYLSGFSLLHAALPSSSSEDDIFAQLDAPVAGPSTPTPAADQEIAIPMDLPVIGTVNLISIPENEQDTNPKTGKKIPGLKVYIPSKGKKLVAGPLSLDEGQLRLVGEVPTYSARITLFGSSGTMRIKNTVKEKNSALTQTSPTALPVPSFSLMELSISFDNNPTIEFIPGKKATLTNVDLILEKNQPITIIASATVLDQPIKITFAINKQGTDAWAEFNNPITFYSIIPQLKGTPAGKIILTSCKFTAKDLISKTKKTTTYLINGKADISQVPGIANTPEAKNITITGNYSVAQGGIFNLTAQTLTLQDIGTIQNAQININTTVQPAALTMTGNAHITFPQLGDLATTLDATITSKGIDFSSTIAGTQEFAKIQLHNLVLHFSSQNKLLSLSGDATIQGYQAKVTISQDSQHTIMAQASLTEKEIKPFSTIAGISQITLKDPQFIFDKKDTGYELAMVGKVNIYGLLLNGTVNITQTSDGKTVTLVKAQAPPHWRLSQGLPSLKGTLFDAIELEQCTFVISNNDYQDTEQGITFKKGVNFVSKTKLSGPLAPVSDFTGTPSTSLITVVGHLASNPLESVFLLSIPNGVVIKKTDGTPHHDVTLGKLELEIAGHPEPVFSLLTTLLVKPSSKDDLLTFTSRISFSGTPPVASLAGTMQGFWTNPFGLNGFEIGNVAAQIGFGPAFPETGIPASIGIAGQMALGDRHAAMALKIPLAGQADTVLCGALDKLTLSDLINMTVNVINKVSGAAIGKTINTVPLPDIGIEKMKLYIAPKATTIGELTFDKGLTVRGILYMPGFKALGNITVSPSGLIAQASCSDIMYGKYGPKNDPILTISRAKKDKTCAPTDMKDLNAKVSNTPPAAPVSPAPSTPDLLDLVDALDPLDSLGASGENLPADQKESLAKARSADVACAPDNTVLTEYCGPTMHIILNMEQDLAKQGILISGLFKVADIFEQEAYCRMDKDSIEFNFQTALGKTTYQGKPLLQTIINGKATGNLSNPDFKVILEFQQYLLEYIKDRSKIAIAQAKNSVHTSIAQATQEANTKLQQASKDVSTGIDKAKADVQNAQDKLDAINKQIESIKASIAGKKSDAKKMRDSLDNDIKTLQKKISDKQKECN